MKHKLTRLLSSALALAALTVFAGCSNLLDSKSSDDGQKIYISFGGDDFARAVNPSVTKEDLTDITITYKDSSENTTTFVSGKTYQQIKNQEDFAYVAAGEYTFTCTAKINERNYKAELTKTISNSSNTLTFDLKHVSNGTYVEGNGTFALSLTVTDANVTKVTACITDLTGSEVEGFEEAVLTAENGTYTYSGELAGGNYLFAFKFYNAESDVYLGSYFDGLSISKGFESADSITVDKVNELVNVTLIYNGGDLSADSTFKLTYAKNKLSGVALPVPVKEGYAFGGWYTDESCETSAVTTLSQDLVDSENKITLYAMWQGFDVSDGAITIGEYSFNMAYDESAGCFTATEIDGATYSWYINGTVVSGETGTTLASSKITGGYGVYNVVVKVLYNGITYSKGVVYVVRCYKINWYGSQIIDVDGTKMSLYELASGLRFTYANGSVSMITDQKTGCSKIVIGTNTKYASAVSDLTGVACDETSSGAVMAYYDSANTALYVLSDKKIVFEDNDVFSFSISSGDEIYNFNYGVFGSCSDATEIVLENIDTSSMTTMANMFYYDNHITSLDVSNFDTSNVTDMSNLFADCTKLTDLKGLDKFVTSKVTDMSCMFKSCEVLTSIDVSNFDTKNVKKMSGMFTYCKAITSIDITGFNTSNVTDMSSMFEECNALTSIDVSKFDTSNVTNMNSVFNTCKNLTSIDLSTWNTKKVTEFRAMFNGCTALETIDISSFEFDSIENFNYMFGYCTSLTAIYVKSGTDLSQKDGLSGTSVFPDCTKLPNFDSDYIDKTYAYVNNGTSGYFSVK